MAPLERAGKSVRQMAERLSQLEVNLSTSAERLAHKFGLSQKNSLRSRLLKATLTATTQYDVRTGLGGLRGSLDMVRLAWTCSRAKLTQHENELDYLKTELMKLREMTVTEWTWRDVSDSWSITLDMLAFIDVERGRTVLQCIAGDKRLSRGLGMAKTLYKIKGDVPDEVLMQLNEGVGAHIRTHAYKYGKLISRELVRIQQIKDMQWRAVTLSGSAVVATMIGTANLFSRLYYDVLESERVLDSERWLMAVLFPAGAVALLLLLLLCCCTCYNRRSLMQGAQRLCGKCWPMKSPALTTNNKDAPNAMARQAAEFKAEQVVSKAESEAVYWA